MKPLKWFSPFHVTEIVKTEKSLLKIVCCSDLRSHKSKTWTSPLQDNVLAESRMMVPDCHKTALADLKATLIRHEKFSDHILKYCALFFLIHVKDCILACWTEGVKWARCWDWRNWSESTVSEVEADIGGTFLCSYGTFFFLPFLCLVDLLAYLLETIMRELWMHI